MSNVYKEWIKDRKEEAWNTLIDIGAIIEKGEHLGDEKSVIYDKIFKTLEAGGWLY